MKSTVAPHSGVPLFLVIGSDPFRSDRVAAELDQRYGHHYEIKRARSGREAIATAERLLDGNRRIALVLSSLSLTDTDGWEAMTAVRAHHPGALRILYLQPGDRNEGRLVQRPLQMGLADHYVLVPLVSPDETFHANVSELLREWAGSYGPHLEAGQLVGESDSSRVHHLLDLAGRSGVAIAFHDVRSVEGRRVLRKVGVDDSVLPVLVLWTGLALRNPTDVEITDAFTGGDTPDWTTFDVSVIGGGPAGLAAGVSGASEGLQSFVLDMTAMGGQAGTTSSIRNYLGFPRGISGRELARRAFDQAWMFGVAFQFSRSADRIARAGDLFVTRLSDGIEVRSRVVVLAPGVDYRRLQIPELEQLVGRGVFYGAAVTEAEAMKNRDVFVVGGGNAAGQAAVHLCRLAKSVTMIVRGPSLSASTSAYLIRQIQVNDNIAVRTNTSIVGGGGTQALEYVDIRDHRGNSRRHEAGGLFVLIGAAPRTDWLPDELLRDEWGYILTGPDVGLEEWPLERAPLPYETSMPGVFAVGDVRHGSVKRVASAAGEGSVVIQGVHAYLADEEKYIRPL
ncbi:MAG: FAD-dependent oxidoreductase [Actinomycetota bacterium]